MNLVIREANIDDCESIHRLSLTGLGYDYPIEKTKQQLAKILSRSNTKLFIADVEGVVAGYIHASDYDCLYFDSLKNILALVVGEEFRGKNIGRELVSAVEDWAKGDGSCGVRLISSIYRTDAHSFYKACGYSFRKDQKNFIKMFET